MLAFLCPQDKALLQDLKARKIRITAYNRVYFKDPYFDGKKWTTVDTDVLGAAGKWSIQILRSNDPGDNAATIYHEGLHMSQPQDMTKRDKEYEAHVKEDRWRLSHGLPPHARFFRTTDSNGKEVTDVPAIRAYIDSRYAGVTVQAPKKGAQPEEIVGHDAATGRTELKRANGTKYWRKSRKGDSYQSKDSITEPPDGIRINLDLFQCC